MADALEGPTSEQHAGVAVPHPKSSVSYMIVSCNDTGPYRWASDTYEAGMVQGQITLYFSLASPWTGFGKSKELYY